MFLTGKTSRFLRNRKPIHLLTRNLRVGKFSQVAELVDAIILNSYCDEENNFREV